MAKIYQLKSEAKAPALKIVRGAQQVLPGNYLEQEAEKMKELKGAYEIEVLRGEIGLSWAFRILKFSAR